MDRHQPGLGNPVHRQDHLGMGYHGTLVLVRHGMGIWVRLGTAQVRRQDPVGTQTLDPIHFARQKFEMVVDSYRQ